MSKKITHKTLERLTMICYNEVLGEILDENTMIIVKETVEDFLNNNGYVIDWVKCNQDNNTSVTIDCNKIIIDICELVSPDSIERINHRIIL